MRRHAWLAALITLAAIGCGTEAGIFADGESSGAGASDGSGGSGGTTTGSGANGTGGDPMTTGVGGDPMTTGVGGAATTTTGVGGDPGALLACGDEKCATNGNSACCWDNYQAYGPPQGACVMGNVANDGCNTSDPAESGQPGIETRIECQNDSFCPVGTTCCGEIRQAFVNNQQITFYESVTCQNECSGLAQGEVTICDPNAPDPCPGEGQQCEQSSLLPQGYFVCVN